MREVIERLVQNRKIAELSREAGVTYAIAKGWIRSQQYRSLEDAALRLGEQRWTLR